MRVRAGLPTGVTALLFEAAGARRDLEHRLAERLGERGYHEALLPILDYFDPYGPLLPQAAREQLYRFVDRDGQLLALRADFTPMLARLLAPRLEALELPLRIFYRGDVVRYQEDKPGQLREYSQLGAELLTEIDDGDAARDHGDAELVDLLLELLLDRLRPEDPEDGRARRNAAAATGRPTVRLVLGLAGALEPLLRSATDPRDLARAVARRDRARARAASAALLEIVEHGFPANPKALGSAAPELERLQRLRDTLGGRFDGRAVTVAVDLAEFAGEGLEIPVAPVSSPADRPPSRGAADHAAAPGHTSYYDGMVFRAYVDGLGQPVASGGRYDGLFRSLGARARAAGFQIALDPLLEATQRSAAPDGGLAVGLVEGAR